MSNAFGVNDGEIAKAGARALLGDAVVAAGTGGGRARKAGKLYRITPPGPTRRGEFGRAFAGAAAGTRVTRGLRAGDRAVGRRLLGEYRTAAHRAQAASPHPGVFRAGERAGRGAEFYTRHAMPINVGTTIGAGGVMAAAGVGADHRRARSNVRAQQVSKGNKAGYALTGATVAGAALGLNEVERRLNNRQGANVGFGHSLRHPVRTGHAYQAAQMRTASTGLGRTATRLQERAASAATPHKREYANLRVARARQSQNYANYLATVHNERAAGRGRRGVKTVGRYDKSKAYTAPETIGKRRDAFGVAR